MPEGLQPYVFAVTLLLVAATTALVNVIRRLRRERDHLRAERAELTQRLHAAQADYTAAAQQLTAADQASERRLKTDPLTGLANRAAVLERIAQIAADSGDADARGAILLLDIDGFKSVNDIEGHVEGDHLLSLIGRRLDAAAREHEVARLGGDEFTVLIHHADNIDDLTVLARELIAAVTKPLVGSSGRSYLLTAGVGIALIDGGTDPAECLAQVDIAALHAKQGSRDKVCVYSERLVAGHGEQADVALTLRQAITDGQFRLELQPVIDVLTRRPVGAEALIRWRHPELGELLPGDFIPIAERSDAIVDLDRWVVEQAVGILRQWRIDARTKELRLAVNISGRHIVEGRLAEMIDAACTRAVVDPDLLAVEITETHLVADISRADATIADLHAHGIGVAIDDFGTGYSSMGYLQKLHIDTLKIDRTFISRLMDEPLDRTIVELLLRLGESLKLRVVAEGVESEAALQTLGEMGCHWAQGYHIARPMAVDAATDWLVAHGTLDP